MSKIAGPIVPLQPGNQLQSKLRETAQAQSDAKLRKVAEQLEATFLAEMLKHSGAGEGRESFGGGTGEAQFASFLRQAHAEEIAKSGGIGLAEYIFEALKETSDEII